MYKNIKTIITEHCSPNPIIFEIGTMDGFFTHKYYNMAIDKPKHYFAFEPNPVNIKKIKNNPTFPKEATLVQRAVGKFNGKTEFWQSSGHPKDNPEQEYDGCSSLRKPKVVLDKFPFLKFKKIKVGCTTLDAFCNQAEVAEIDIIISDIQGAEKDMIMGGENILKKTKFIVLEKSVNDELYKGQWLESDYLENLKDWKIYSNHDYDIILYNSKLVKL